MWLYNNTEINNIDNFPENCFGFVYKITNLKTGQFYIGKKQLKMKKSAKITKKALSQINTRGRKPSKITTLSESNWSSYFGSCKPLLEDIKQQGESTFKREIIHLCYNKRQLTYYEIKYQFEYNVLADINSYNENIQGKFFPRDL